MFTIEYIQMIDTYTLQYNGANVLMLSPKLIKPFRDLISKAAAYDKFVEEPDKTDESINLPFDLTDLL